MSKRNIMSLEALAPVERAFCLALADDPKGQGTALAALIAAVGEPTFRSFVQREQCECVVALAALPLESSLPATWVGAASIVRERLRLYMEQLDHVAANLAAHGIRMVALKNSGIARGLYPDLAGCPMGDIDVLVSPRDFRRAHECMKSLGFELGNRSPFEADDIEQAEKHGGAEYTICLSNGEVLWFELQWRPVAGRWIRPDQEPPADLLLERSVVIPGTNARLLAPEDNLLQVCLHTAKHSFVRAPGFRLHTDVDRIVRRCSIDWDSFAGRVEKIGVRTAVYLSLAIPAALLHTPVPEAVLRRLDHAPCKHRRMLRWLRRVGLFGPHERKWSRPGYIVFNLMLYDGAGGVLRGIFPTADWMCERYGVKRRWSLPWWYLVRGLALAFKRAKT